MLTVLVFLMIFMGATFTWYQIYQMHFNINTYNSSKLSGKKKSQFESLRDCEKRAIEKQDISIFDKAVADVFEKEFNLQALRIAFSSDGQETYGVPLVKRKKVLFSNAFGKKCSSKVGARHALFFKTGLPSINLRKFFIVAVIANSGLIQLLAAMSVYTIHYEVGVTGLEWVNQPVMIMAMIFFIVLMNYLLSKLDAYTHDLYQVGKLNKMVPIFK